MKKNYNTKQRQIVLDAVRESAGSHFSVEDIYSRITKKGIQLGKATVYRHINELQEEEVIRKFVTEVGKSACYEFAGEVSCSCYHFKCTNCGELLHVNCDSLDGLKSHLLSEHGFELNDSKMVFLGLCNHCREK